MKLTVTMNDDDSPIFDTEGKLDLDSLLSDIVDKDEVKEIFTERFEKLSKEITIDSKKINSAITKSIIKAFDFKDVSKDMNKNLLQKFNSSISGVKIDSSFISSQIKSVFDFKDVKNKIDGKLKGIVPDDLADKVKSSKSTEISGKIEKIKGAVPVTNLMRDTKTGRYKKGDWLKETMDEKPTKDKEADKSKKEKKDEKIEDKTEKGESSLNQFIIMSISSTAQKQLTEIFKGSNKDLYDIQKQSLGFQKDYYNLAKEKYLEEKRRYDEEQEKIKAEDTSFKNEDKKPDINIINEEKKDIEKAELNNQPEQKSGSMLEKLFGFTGSEGLMGLLVAKFPTLSNVMKFATNPVTLLGAGLIWAVIDGIKGFFKAEEWGTSKLSAVIGSVLGGTDSGLKGALAGMGKWALIGAGIGSIVPGIGTLLGAFIGSILGGLLGFIGGEKIAKFFEPLIKWFDENIMGGLKNLWTSLTGWWTDDLLPSIDRFKKDMEPVYVKIESFFEGLKNDILIIYNEMKPAIDVISKVLGFAGDKLKTLFGLIADKFGDAIVGLFNNLGPAIEAFVDTVSFIKDVVVESILIAIKGIKKFGEVIGEMFNFFTEDKWKEYIPSWARKLFGIEGESEGERTKSLTEASEKRSQLAEMKIKESQDQINSLLNKEDVTDEDRAKVIDLENQIKTYKEIQKSAAKDAARGNVQVQTAKDNVVSISYNGKVIQQTQLSSSDKLEQMGNTSVFSQEGGTLDKSFKSMNDVLNKQLVELNNIKANFVNGLNELIAINDKINKNIQLMSSSNSDNTNTSVEPKIPDGYIRDPIYEYRMKMREAIS